jgi:hypothetical protein
MISIQHLSADGVQLKTASEAARHIGRSMGTLAAWRGNNSHPLPFLKQGKYVFYRVSDLDAFVAARVQTGGVA